MPNLKIVSDNALERATSLTASSTAGALAAGNLANWKKSSLWRATGTSARITALFASPEPTSFAGFPFCNWSPTAQIRVRVSEEGSGTNLYKYSELFDNTVWAKAACTAPAAANLAPDGTNTAEKLTEDATTAAHYVAQTVGGFIQNQTVTVSVLVKAAERNFFAMRFDTASTAAPFVAVTYVNLTTGARTNETAGGWTFKVTPAPNGYWRVSATRVTTAAGNIIAMFHSVASAGTISYLGTLGSGILIWGAMLQPDELSSYYPSGAAAATRPAGYIDAWQSYDYDSGWVPACPWPAAKLRGYTAVQAASAYAYGGGTYAPHWLPAEFQARGLAVDIADPDNVQGYLEAACMVAGPTWSPKYNASAISVTPIDSSESVMTGAGDTCGEVGFISDEISIDLTYMDEADRATVMAMARNSAVYPLLISGFPNDPAPARERDHMIYATRSKSSAIALKYAAAYTTSITFKEV